jgi:hypothetical protein
MYIEFYVPDDKAQTISANVLHFIRQNVLVAVDAWANRYGIAYRSKAVRNTLRVTFDQDSYYTLFATTWQPPQAINAWWFTYRIVDPMNIQH